ncbi:MAG: potassium channel family protein [Acidobacteriota bacterium]|nr:potassium channel family protein [Acidobacteriota bacterium]
MIHIRPSRLTTLLDRLTGRHLALAAIAVTVMFAFGYWQLSKHFPNHGLIEPETPQSISLSDAFYFSITTETTLGYGDIRPVGLSRLLACSQVFLGLLLAGIAVAKITSLSGRELRLASQNASGNWIESIRLPDGPIILTFATISFDGKVLRYDGENFTPEGEPCGFFKGEMIEISDNFLRFRYSNRDSDTEFFDEGVANLHFTGDAGTSRWTRYQATAHDFGKRRVVNYEGFRASTEESLIIHGADFSARQQLVRTFLSKLYNAKSSHKNAP